MLGNSPHSTYDFQLERAKSYALNVFFKDRDEQPYDLTDCTVRFTMDEPARFGGASVLIEDAVIVDASEGHARLNFQAADLDVDPREYPYDLTLVTAESYAQPILKGAVAINSNTDSSSALVEFEETVTPSSSLDVWLRGGDSVTVKFSHMVVSGGSSGSDGAAADVAYSDTGNALISGNDVQAALDSADGAINTLDLALGAHFIDDSAAHAASAISATGFSGHLAGATDVQGALDALDAAEFEGTLAGVFPVANYGAVGDGATNDAVAINAAASDAAAVGGVVVFEGDKTYAVSVPVNILSNVTYQGQGEGSTFIKALASFTGDAVLDYGAGGQTDVVIERLTVDGNKANTTGNINGINNPVSTDCVIRNVTVKNCRTRGVYLYDSEGATLDNVKAVDCGVGNDGDTGTYVGIAVHGDNHTLTNCRVIRPSGIGIAITGASDATQLGTCRVIDPGYIGIGFGGSNATRPTATNCVVVGAVAGPGFDTGNAYHSNLTGCTVGDSWAGFVSDSGRWQTFTGCHVDKPQTLHGFDITGSPDSTLTGCTVFIGDDGVGRGFQFVSSPRSTATGCSVNEPHPDWEAFQVHSSDNVTLSACSVTDGRVSPAATPAFQIAGTSSNVLVAGAQVFGLAAADVYQDVSTGTGNIAHLIGSGTPEGVLAADVGSTFTDRASGTVYVKATGTGNTGWAVLGSGGGGASSADDVTYDDTGNALISGADVQAALDSADSNLNSLDSALGAHLTDADAAHAASAISVDASGFNGRLATTDNTVQKVAQKVDDLSVGGTPRGTHASVTASLYESGWSYGIPVLPTGNTPASPWTVNGTSGYIAGASGDYTGNSASGEAATTVNLSYYPSAVGIAATASLYAPISTTRAGICLLHLGSLGMNGGVRVFQRGSDLKVEIEYRTAGAWQSVYVTPTALGLPALTLGYLFGAVLATWDDGTTKGSFALQSTSSTLRPGLYLKDANGAGVASIASMGGVILG